MKIYLVGGAVRDELLGRPVKERDYVVVGATPDELLAQGFQQVGKDFPVFLHPQTKEEYALARTERKTAPGHRGFSVHADPAVTLEQDLQRRDLTINALARDLQGRIIPGGGCQYPGHAGCEYAGVHGGGKNLGPARDGSLADDPGREPADHPR